jgi:hypothetical protein
MNEGFVEKHRAFVRDVVELNKSEKDAAKAEVLGVLRRLALASGGNARRFQALVAQSRPYLKKLLLQRGKSLSVKATARGRAFAAYKLNQKAGK